MSDLFTAAGLAPAEPPPLPAAPEPPKPRTPPVFDATARLRTLDRFATPEELADPAFAAIYDVVRQWTVWVPERNQAGAGFCMAWHVQKILTALRERGCLKEEA